MRDPYSVLGVKRDAGADEIKAAWRTAAKASHPDQNRNDPDATKRFAELGRAYEVLKDPAKRSRYDMQREKVNALKREQTIQQQREAAREAAERAKAAKAKAEQVMADLAEAEKAKAQKAKPASAGANASSTAGAGSSAGAEDVVNMIFGESPEAAAAAANLRRDTEAKSDAKSEAKSDSKSTASETDENAAASKSGGSLLDPLELLTSLLRRFRGKQAVEEKAPDLFVDANVTIDDLLKGNSVSLPLPDGRQLRYTPSAGVADGHVARLKNQGLKIAGMQRGDITVTVKVTKDPAFTVDGFDIHTILPITLEHAVLGYTTRIPGPEGEVEVTVPAWSGSDQKIRIEGLGLREVDGNRGALVVELRVLLWEKPDDKVTDLMRLMREGLYL